MFPSPHKHSDKHMMKPQDTLKSPISPNTDAFINPSYSSIDSSSPLERNLLLICSIVVCILFVTGATLVTKYCINKTGKINTSTTITARQTASPSEKIDSTLWYGNYSGNLDSSLLTISKGDNLKLIFTVSVSKGTCSKPLSGNATITGANTAKYEGSDGLILLFTLDNGIITISKDPNCVVPQRDNQSSLLFTGDYINIDGNTDFKNNNYFHKIRSFGCDITYNFDLNQDGKTDCISYKSGVLTINKYSYNFAEHSDNLDTSHFHIIDLDMDDKYLNLLIMDDGLSGNPITTVITYTPDNKIIMSTINCNVSHLTFDNHGLIHGIFRLNLLQIWYSACKWNYKVTTVSFVKQKYYTPTSLNNKNRKKQSPSTLITSIHIYKKDDAKSAQIVLKPQAVKFIKTDNIHWVEVMGLKDHTTGWLYLDNYNRIVNEKKNTEEVFVDLILPQNTD